MNEPRAYFARRSEHRFLPLQACAGAWNPEVLHISPVNGLLVHELERWLAARGADDRPIARISLDYLGVIGFDECELAFEVLRPGKAVELVEGVLSQNGRAALRARVWRMAAGDTAAVAGGEREPLPPVGSGKAFDMSAIWPGDYIASIDMRAVDGPTPGHARAWLTTALPLVEGEATSDLSHFVLLVDTANGIAVRRSPDEWEFPNVDLTIHLFRQPRGRWVGYDTRVTFGPHGHGLTSSDLFDEHGHVGHAEQILLVRPR